MINLFKVYSPPQINETEIFDILRSGSLTSGIKVKEFETLIGNYIGNPNILVTANNNYASLIALALVDLGPDDEVIASPMACLASNQPIINFKAKIVWADIDPHTGTLDPQDVKLKISSKTKLILHYHWCGYPGYIDEINEIGLKNGILVLDDAIESFGSKYKNNFIGNVGTDLTTFSFQTVRLPNSIDGGAIAFKSTELYEKAKRIRDFGIDRTTFRDEFGEISSKSDIAGIGYNAVMNELNASIGIEVLKDTPTLLDLQKENAKQWDSFLPNDTIKLGSRTEIEPNFWVYSFLTKSQQKDLIDYRAYGYYASKVHLRNDYYSCFGKIDYSLKGVKEFENQQLSLPCGWWFKK